MNLAAQALVPDDDALDLTLRLVLHLFGKVFEAPATATFTAPGSVMLLGGGAGGPALAVPMRWGAKVASRPRTDGRLVVSAVHRLTEQLSLDLTAPETAPAPGWAAGVARLGRSVLGAGSGGASLFAFMDVPEQSGIASGAALHCAAALAMDAITGSHHASARRVLAALGAAPGESEAAASASMLGRPGFAIMVTPEGSRRARFDPAAAGLRLIVVSTRPQPSSGQVSPWSPFPVAPWEDSAVAQAFQALRREDWLRLAGYLSASHEICRRQRDRAESDLIVDTALAAGALGARATSAATALALAPTRGLRELRMAVWAAFRQQALPAPRFLTTGALPPATARPSQPLEA